MPTLAPNARGKLSSCKGPAQPRGTGFAEQAAIQYFVFSSLFNVWPQAKPCSEYRTGAFLTGFLTGSPRAVAGHFTSTFIVMPPHLPNWKLRNREIRISSSCASEHLHEDPQGPGFLGHFTYSKHKSCWCPLWLCTTVQIPGSYLGKKQCEEQTVWGLPQQAGLKGAADSSQEWRKFSKVVHCSICLPSNFCHKWAQVLQKPLPSLPSPQLTTSEGAGTHRSEARADVCSLGEVP